MDSIHVFAILISVTALFSYINLRYVGLPVSIGVMVIALGLSLPAGPERDIIILTSENIGLYT